MFTRVSEIVAQGLEDGLLSGAAVGIVQGDQVLHASYHGRIGFAGEDAPIDRQTRFDMASLTKIVCTTMISLRFIDRGLMRLDDKVSDFFPAATTAGDISIRQLLTHTSGLPAHFLLESELERPSQVLDHLLHRPLENPIGSVESYSCIGFILLGEILQRVSGKDLVELFREEVLIPLDLEVTGFNLLKGEGADTATTVPKLHHTAKTKDARTGTYLQGIVHDENARFLKGVSANAGLFSSMTDLLRFSQMLINDGRHNGRAYLSPAVLKAARENYTPGLAEDRGLGFFLGTNKGSSMGDLASGSGFGHTGFTGTSLLIVPEYDLGVVFLSNRVISDQAPRATVRLRALLHNSIIAAVSSAD